MDKDTDGFDLVDNGRFPWKFRGERCRWFKHNGQWLVVGPSRKVHGHLINDCRGGHTNIVTVFTSDGRSKQIKVKVIANLIDPKGKYLALGEPVE